LKAQTILVAVARPTPARQERRCFGNYASKRICDSCKVEKWCRQLSLEDPLLLGS